eukprot:SAG31_NODE_3128_length_4646_cov_3.749285_1_plen_141_part_00
MRQGEAAREYSAHHRRIQQCSASPADGRRMLAPVTALLLCPAAPCASAPPPAPPAPVPLFRTFEVAIPNGATQVENKFSGVWLNASFSGPPNSREASRPTQFWGFYDGGSTWRLRFMPSAVGPWCAVPDCNSGHQPPYDL